MSENGYLAAALPNQRGFWNLNVKIPMPLLLNERIQNPKFISRFPKSNMIKAMENSVKFSKTKSERRKINNKKNAVRSKLTIIWTQIPNLLTLQE